MEQVRSRGLAVSQQSLREMNAAMVLGFMREFGGPVNVGELMELTGLTRATVIAICEDLVDRGWVRELENGRSTAAYVKGRPARRFAFDAQAAFVLGIDIGNRRMTAVLADMAGTAVSRIAVPFQVLNAPAQERAALLRAITDDALVKAGVAPERILAVSLGVAAPVSREGEVLTAQEFWGTFDVRKELSEWHGWTVLIENDANLAALAERWQGTAEGIDDLVVVLAGDRLGSGVLESGRLLHGTNGAFGELGYLYNLEGVGDPMGMAYWAHHWGKEVLDSGATTELRELCHGDPSQLTAEAVFAAAADHDTAAIEIVNRLSLRMARVIGSFSTMLNPEIVVLAGGVAAPANAVIPIIEKYLPTFTSTPPKVKASTLGDSIVSIGAVRHALNYVEERALTLRPHSMPDHSGTVVPEDVKETA
jgi:predicted NBD/HSP70 family sugar kinase